MFTLIKINTLTTTDATWYNGQGIGLDQTIPLTEI